MKLNKEKIYSFENDILSFNSYKNLHTQKYYDDLEQQALEIELGSRIDDLIDGHIVNKTEKRAAYHPKYRKDTNKYNNENISLSFLKRCKACLLKTNKSVNIITLGIGGSFEGPKLLLESFNNPANKIFFENKEFNHKFITGSDPIEFDQKTMFLDPDNTFFLVSSKSFTTDEVIENLKKAFVWSPDKSKFIAITANPDEARKHGIDEVITFDEEIGGRYSIWSPITQFHIFGDQRQSFIEGGYRADNDIRECENYFNFIKRLSFTDILNNNNGKNVRAILSYIWNLRSLPNYFQQLEMESLGKPPNTEFKYKNTGQIIFGGYGPTAQHSYFQLFHQGTQNICADIISTIEQKETLAYAQAATQSKLLSFGHDLLESHEKINANIPVNFFELVRLDPFSLGYLIASWEYRTYISAIMLGINPFDQFGVNAGKIYTKKYLVDKD